MGAISTTLNLNGNMGTRMAALQRRAEMLYTSMQKLGRLNITPPQSFNTYAVPMQQSAASAVGTVRTLRQSVLDLNKAVAGTRGACAEAAKGIKNISNSAQEANRRVSSLATNLGRLNRVRLPNLNSLPSDSAYAVLGNMVQSLKGSLDNVNSSLSNFSSRASRANSALSGTSGAAANAANGIRNVGNAAQEAARHTASLVASLTAAWVVYGSFHAARSLFETSDTMTSIESRLRIGIDQKSIQEAKAQLAKDMDSIPVGVSLEDAATEAAVGYYKDKIMAISDETRQKFTETANFASKLMVNVGGKAFKSTNELLDFTKTLNKFLVISGSTGSEVTSTLTQLPQALSSGTLQGDELKALRENAPLIKNVIQDYANKVLNLKGDIKDLGAEGKITARTVVDAIKWGADTANKKMDKMPWTWTQKMNVFGNSVERAMDNVFGKIKQLANMQVTGKVFADMADVITFFAGSIVKVVSVMGMFATALSHIGLLYPLVTGTIIAMTSALTLLIAKKVRDIAVGALQIALETAAWALKKMGIAVTEEQITVQGILNAIRLVGCEIMLAYRTGALAEMAADIAASAGKWLLIAACVVLLPLIIALAPVFLALAAVMWVLSAATGVAAFSTIALKLAMLAIPFIIALIIGAVIAFGMKLVSMMNLSRSVFYYIGFLFGWLYAGAYNCFAGIWNVVVAFVNFFYNVFDDPVTSVQNLFRDLATTVIGYIEKIAQAIDKIFDTNWAGAVSSLKGKVEAMMGVRVQQKKLLNEMEYKDAMETAEAAGNALEEGAGSLGEKVKKLTDTLQGGYDDYQGGAGGAGDNLKGIKGDTGRIAQATEKTAENLDWLITANERRAINAFTNHNYQVPVNVTINGNDRNLAGIAEEIRWNLTDYLTERLSSGAEGAVQGV